MGFIYIVGDCSKILLAKSLIKERRYLGDTSHIYIYIYIVKVLREIYENNKYGKRKRNR